MSSRKFWLGERSEEAHAKKVYEPRCGKVCDGCEEMPTLDEPLPLGRAPYRFGTIPCSAASRARTKFRPNPSEMGENS
jgi:hypothetical protein